MGIRDELNQCISQFKEARYANTVVFIKQLTFAEVEEWRADQLSFMRDDKGEVQTYLNLETTNLKLLQLTLHDDQKKRIFADNELDMIGRMCPVEAARLVKEAMEYNGLNTNAQPKN